MGLLSRIVSSAPRIELEFAKGPSVLPPQYIRDKPRSDSCFLAKTERFRTRNASIDSNALRGDLHPVSDKKRILLIALNATLGLEREVICHLALNLDVWWHLAESRSIPRDGQSLRLSKKVLTKARRIACNPDAVTARELQRAEKLGATVVTLVDPGYPEQLRDLPLPPPVLYCRGTVTTAPGIAIVGSRQASRLGRQVAELAGRELALRGLNVVSGFARGVDAAAHRGALSATGGRTVAVLGCGLDFDYPRGHRGLGDRIAARGAVVTEFPFGTRPAARNFPVRNRIIAALAEGTLVVEATPRSGSLITARLALELGRDVYAIPGALFNDRSVGPNSLIRDGALLVQHPRDIIESLPWEVQRQLAPEEEQPGQAPLSGPKGSLLALMKPGHIYPPEALSSSTSWPIERVLALLLELELSGWVRRHPGPTFGRSR
jgi:DNA processing protein